jgi:hypothetical protein
MPSPTRLNSDTFFSFALSIVPSIPHDHQHQRGRGGGLPIFILHIFLDNVLTKLSLPSSPPQPPLALWLWVKRHFVQLYPVLMSRFRSHEILITSQLTELPEQYLVAIAPSAHPHSQTDGRLGFAHGTPLVT